MKRKLLALLLALSMVMTLALPGLAAETGGTKGYLVLGADLSTEQQMQVMEIFGVDDPAEYSVSYISNQQEHDAFDDYLSASVIGSKAVSCVLVTPLPEGSGIQIKTTHITYVTESMIKSALITAGAKDVMVHVAAPFDVSGTAGLLGAMSAYGDLTGKAVDATAADAAVDELITTGEIADVLGDKETAVELMALLKEYLAEHGDEVSDEELSETIDRICVELKITLDENMKQQIITLLRKLQHTDIDPEVFRQQAGELYDRVSGLLELVSGGQQLSSEGVMGFLQSLFGGFIQWLTGLIGG